MEDISYRVQNEATKVFTELDKEVLRKMQGDMHRCSANCCDNKTAGIDDVQKCIENCAGPLTRAQNFMQQEVENFQNRLNRCAMDCQDKVRDKMTTNISETQRLQLGQEMESCVKKCADDHIRKLPELSKKLKSNISSMK
ncbi:protein FAM136A-like [Mercenaria mercenaria]|uniref:protein FAM136A-like n=1 Tax=Mercenaria mercenaria TaxID=6596 RepID=UPI001E1E0DDA|nr:protein FAM136A-like [Mercenaria mercenaria]